MVDGADIIPFKKPEGEASPSGPGERDQFLVATIENLLAVQAQQEQQIGTLIALMSEQQAHINDLEHDMARLKKAEAKKPAILNAQGARAN